MPPKGHNFRHLLSCGVIGWLLLSSIEFSAYGKETRQLLCLPLFCQQDTINHLSNQNAELRQALVDKRVNQVDKESGSLKRRRSAEEQGNLVVRLVCCGFKV